ncbi:MAG: class I SAM-dependent methyltransferase [Propionibacteriaceae bacterium]|nr:class I SAM-dependent methyltransferase [Propionibacteriaceae bacterium]
MFRKLLRNAGKPQGFWGRLMMRGMNKEHAWLSRWGLRQISLAEDAAVLDIGCGGGANLARLLAACPRGQVTGIDHSEVAVQLSRKRNASELGRRCEVVQGSVVDLPFEDARFDAVTAVETVYFWPDLPRAFAEVYRVLRSPGCFLIINEVDGRESIQWADLVDGMTTYSPQQLTDLLTAAGFQQVETHRCMKHTFCLVAHKP